METDTTMDKSGMLPLCHPQSGNVVVKMKQFRVKGFCSQYIDKIVNIVLGDIAIDNTSEATVSAAVLPTVWQGCCTVHASGCLCAASQVRSWQSVCKRLGSSSGHSISRAGVAA